jgi:branched-chain amino acid transport system permease protein
MTLCNTPRPLEFLRRNGAHAALLVLALITPWGLTQLDQTYYLGWLTRALIFALAASSLNFLIRQSGLVALGHAGFLGAGAYLSTLLPWPLALLGVAGLATALGAVSLRTRGVYFLMITLAFAQMLYYLVVALPHWGGEDGVNLPGRQFSETALYYLALAALSFALLVLAGLTRHRFGQALVGVRENEVRMQALGYATYGLQLAAFVLTATLAGLAGVLLAEHNQFISPSLMHWTQSATLLVMVVIGGARAGVMGGVVGTFVYLGLQEVLARYTEHWHLVIGCLLLGLALWRIKTSTHPKA